ncbi:MAG: Crp/Fnr family transcriptional regulator [Pseudomonadota bacterium]
MDIKNHTTRESEFFKITKLLSCLALFDKVPEKMIMHFAEKSYFKTQKKGKILFFHGDEALCFFVMIDGWVKLFRETFDGSEAILDVLDHYGIFGLDSLFNDKKYTYSAEIVEDAKYLVLPTSLLHYYMQKNQQITINILGLLSKNQLSQSREIEHFHVQNAPQKIGCFLLRLCNADHKDWITINLPYDKSLISSRLGMKPETFSRGLFKLKQDTDLEIKGSSITIKNIQKMVDYTCNHCSQIFLCNNGHNKQDQM